MTSLEHLTWTLFVEVTKHFVGNHKSSNYSKIVNNILENLQNTSIKEYYLHSHLDKFPKKFGSYCEEEGEQFHQEVKTMEDRYQDRRDSLMMADIPPHSRKWRKSKLLYT